MRKAAILLFACLTGCAGMKEARHQNDLARAHKECVSYGFQPDTPEFPACLQQSVQAMNSMRMAAAAANYASIPKPGYQAPVTTSCRPDGAGRPICITR